MTKKTVRIVHVSDTHLDPTARYLGPKELERRKDFLRAFNHVISRTRELKPDVMLIAGDLYDRVNPRNPTRMWVMKAFRKLHHDGVRIYIIGGNHDTPRSVEEGASPLHVLDAAGYVRFFSRINDMEADTVDINGYSVCISGASFNHTLPHEEDPIRVMKTPREGDINIAILHYNYGPARPPPMWSAPTIRETNVPKDLHYLALGHYHRYYVARVGLTHIVCPGSTERRSFAEEGESKGFVYAELDEKGVKKLEFLETNPRPLKTVSVTIREEDANPTRKVIMAVKNLSDLNMILRIRVRGRISLKKLIQYSRDEILKELSDLFFYTLIDDRELEYTLEQPELGGIEEFSPLKLYDNYLTRLLNGVDDEEKRKILQEALQTGKRLLEEAGAW